ncbi:hypothetical protein FA95DRAFT_760743 [Auriscalpium vulgare]|uniref:Uncharacterized protein n=1 Tax=Auriscalpium vulgare TaxID=40419 RepID=A0ACB8S296_9AGAM|nr:hypothetical protein FA95DRAFT_760743 [Auriscalpium vulgare]
MYTYYLNLAYFLLLLWTYAVVKCLVSETRPLASRARACIDDRLNAVSKLGRAVVVTPPCHSVPRSECRAPHHIAGDLAWSILHRMTGRNNTDAEPKHTCAINGVSAEVVGV